jgi:hypothetical protein
MPPKQDKSRIPDVKSLINETAKKYGKNQGNPIAYNRQIADKAAADRYNLDSRPAFPPASPRPSADKSFPPTPASSRPSADKSSSYPPGLSRKSSFVDEDTEPDEYSESVPGSPTISRQPSVQEIQQPSTKKIPTVVPPLFQKSKPGVNPPPKTSEYKSFCLKFIKVPHNTSGRNTSFSNTSGRIK